MTLHMSQECAVNPIRKAKTKAKSIQMVKLNSSAVHSKRFRNSYDVRMARILPNLDKATFNRHRNETLIQFQLKLLNC